MSRMIAFNNKKEQDLFSEPSKQVKENSTVLEHFRDVVIDNSQQPFHQAMKESIKKEVNHY
ncbi:MAG: hypothetical protein WC860_00010 [Candidatus Margulisiibacteriota bacterium]|jgi:hypothetical protein